MKLRTVTDADVEVFFQQQNEAEGREMAAFVRKDSGDRAAFVAHWQRIRQDPAVRMRTIDDQGAVAGSVLSYETDGQPEVSYWLGRKHWGRGLATAAVKEFLKSCDRRRPMLARAAKDNRASLRVLEKCGFVRIAEDKGFAEGLGAVIEEWTLRLD